MVNNFLKNFNVYLIRNRARPTPLSSFQNLFFPLLRYFVVILLILANIVSICAVFTISPIETLIFPTLFQSGLGGGYFCH